MLSYDDQYAACGFTPVANHFICDLMPAARGDHVKVYLYGLMLCAHGRENLTMQDFARELGMEVRDVEAAFRHWEFAGLVRRVRTDPPEFRYVNPVQAGYLQPEFVPDPAQAAFMESLYAAFDGKRELHGQDIRRVTEWVEELGLPQDVVLILVRHLRKTRGINFSFLSKEAETLAEMLANAHAATVEQASDLLTRDQEIEDGARAVLRRFRQRHAPSQDELELYRKWTREWQFTPETILEACSRTTSGTPSFAYLDAILRRRYESGAVTAQQQSDAENEENGLREVISAAGLTGLGVNDGTLAIYRDMLALYPQEVVLRAAQQCAARRNASMEDVLDGLKRWNKRGLQDLAGIDAFIARHNAQTELLRRLAEVWGQRPASGQANRDLVEKWEAEWGFPPETIVHCAAWAADANRTMPYLDSILEDLHGKGALTPAQADAAREQYRARSSSAPKQDRTVTAQQYEQRDYSQEPEARLPDWYLEALRKEQSGDDT